MADIPTTIRFREIKVPLGALCREFLPGLPPSGNGLAACNIRSEDSLKSYPRFVYVSQILKSLKLALQARNSLPLQGPNLYIIGTCKGKMGTESGIKNAQS